MLQLRVVKVERPIGSMACAVGVDKKGRKVRFLGDARMMVDVSEALRSRRRPRVTVEFWQVVA